MDPWAHNITRFAHAHRLSTPLHVQLYMYYTIGALCCLPVLAAVVSLHLLTIILSDVPAECVIINTLYSIHEGQYYILIAI